MHTATHRPTHPTCCSMRRSTKAGSAQVRVSMAKACSLKQESTASGGKGRKGASDMSSQT